MVLNLYLRNSKISIKNKNKNIYTLEKASFLSLSIVYPPGHKILNLLGRDFILSPNIILTENFI